MVQIMYPIYQGLCSVQKCPRRQDLISLLIILLKVFFLHGRQHCCKIVTVKCKSILLGKYSKSLVEPLSRALRKAALIGFYRGCNHHKVEDKEENCWNCAEQNHTLLLSKLPTTYFHNLNKKFVLSLPINLSCYPKMLTGIGFGGLQAKTVCLFVGLHHKLGQEYTHAQAIARSEAIYIWIITFTSTSILCTAGNKGTYCDIKKGNPGYFWSTTVELFQKEDNPVCEIQSGMKEPCIVVIGIKIVTK